MAAQVCGTVSLSLSGAEYDHDGGQNVQSDVMFNIDPDNHSHASIPTDTKYYSDEQFVRDVSNPRETYLSYILMLEV